MYNNQEDVHALYGGFQRLVSTLQQLSSLVTSLREGQYSKCDSVSDSDLDLPGKELVNSSTKTFGHFNQDHQKKRNVALMQAMYGNEAQLPKSITTPHPIPSQLLPIKHQTPNLNTLPRLRIPFMPRINNSRMRNPPRPSIRLRIKTLNEQRLIRSLRILEIPPMRFVRFHRERLPLAIGIDEFLDDEV